VARQIARGPAPSPPPGAAAASPPQPVAEGHA